MTVPTASLTYASMVSRESIRIAFLIAALNDLEILAADISNAYQHAPCRERVYTICGPEFGSEESSRRLSESNTGLSLLGLRGEHIWQSICRRMVLLRVWLIQMFSCDPQ
jgi:hypothetical protein